MTTPTLHHRRDARAPATLLGAGGAVVLGVVLFTVFDAVWWIALPICLIALPALVEAVRGRVARLDLDATHIRWHSGTRRGEVALTRIEEAQFRTTFDLSPRLVLRLDDGQKARIPPECLPKGHNLQHALEAKGVRTKRTILMG